VLQRCVTPEEGKTILKEIHEGICAIMPAAEQLLPKRLRQDFIGSQQFKMQKT